MAAAKGKPSADLQQLVADADLGGRDTGGLAGKLIFALAVAWSLFQLWYASPLPFEFGWGILNDTEARSLHLGVALLLAFLCFPFLKQQRTRIPWFDWLLAIAGAFAGAYFLLFYNELATRPGRPILQDIVVASVGLVLLLEATRRAV
ncbi:MAG TPA: C4-dicarboxylate ABC transporter, partial [Burkholderiales bacterium]